MERSIIHMIFHFLVPFMVAKAAWKENWLRPFMIMVLTMAVDLDHLLADPIFDPNRCGLGFHPHAGGAQPQDTEQVVLHPARPLR